MNLASLAIEMAAVATEVEAGQVLVGLPVPSLAADRGRALQPNFHTDFLAGHLELAEATGAWIGYGQRVTNHACQPMSEDAFIDLVTSGQPSAPAYFVYDAILNRKQHPTFHTHQPRPIEMAELLDDEVSGAVVLDVRDPREFAAGHLLGSINVPADGRFAEIAGERGGLGPADRRGGPAGP